MTLNASAFQQAHIPTVLNLYDYLHEDTTDSTLKYRLSSVVYQIVLNGHYMTTLRGHGGNVSEIVHDLNTPVVGSTLVKERSLCGNPRPLGAGAPRAPAPLWYACMATYARVHTRHMCFSRFGFVCSRFCFASFVLGFSFGRFVR
jgi:hypothetical protein